MKQILTYLQQVHPLAKGMAALTGLVTLWAQYGPQILPHLTGREGQIITAGMAFLALIIPPKKSS